MRVKNARNNSEVICIGIWNMYRGQSIVMMSTIRTSQTHSCMTLTLLVSLIFHITQNRWAKLYLSAVLSCIDRAQP